MPEISEFLRSMTGESARTADGDSDLFGFTVDGLRVGLRVARGDGVADLREVVFQPVRPEVLSPKSVRGAPLGSLLASARATLADEQTSSGGEVLATPSRARLGAFLTPRKGVPLTDADYAQLALEYVLILQDGDRSPARTLSERHGHGSASQWANRIGEARRRGLLTAGQRGKATGSLTPLAERLLGSGS